MKFKMDILLFSTGNWMYYYLKRYPLKYKLLLFNLTYYKSKNATKQDNLSDHGKMYYW